MKCAIALIFLLTSSVFASTQSVRETLWECIGGQAVNEHGGGVYRMTVQDQDVWKAVNLFNVGEVIPFLSVYVKETIEGDKTTYYSQYLELEIYTDQRGFYVPGRFPSRYDGFEGYVSHFWADFSLPGAEEGLDMICQATKK